MRDPASEQRFRDFLAAKAARWGPMHRSTASGSCLSPAADRLGEGHCPICCLPTSQEPLASHYCLASLGIAFGLPVAGVLLDGLMAVPMPSNSMVKLVAIPYGIGTNMHDRECNSAAAPCNPTLRTWAAGLTHELCTVCHQLPCSPQGQLLCCGV